MWNWAMPSYGRYGEQMSPEQMQMAQQGGQQPATDEVSELAKVLAAQPVDPAQMQMPQGPYGSYSHMGGGQVNAQPGEFALKGSREVCINNADNRRPAALSALFVFLAI